MPAKLFSALMPGSGTPVPMMVAATDADRRSCRPPTHLHQVSLSIDSRTRRALKLPVAEAGSSPIAQDELIALVHPDERDHFRRTLDWASFDGAGNAKLVVRIARADGEWVSVVAEIAPGDNRRPVATLSLEPGPVANRAEALLRQIVEGARQAAVVHVDGKTVYANPALAQLMGYASLEELRERGASIDHTHPDDRAMVHRRMAERIAGGGAPESYEFRTVRVDGTTIWVECFASRITWNGQSASLAWLLDITERKRAQEALRQSEKLFGIVFKASPEMMVLSRHDDGRIIDVNDSFLRAIGRKRDQVIGRTEREIELFVDPKLSRRLDRTARDDAASEEIFAAIHTASGEQREISVTVRMIRFAGSDMMLSVGHDVTLRRREEEELRRSKEAAEFANRAKSEFLANMSHELRTPLNAVIGFSEIIASELFGPVGTPQYAEYATDIRDSGRHLLQIINDLLDLSKLEAGKQGLEESGFVVADLVDDCLRLVTQRAAAAGVGVATELAPTLPVLWGDRRILKQVLINLLSNAIKFTPCGGRVTVTGRLDAAGAALLEVRDTGIGMSAADIEVALTPFGQVGSALTRRHQGTGLGLPLVRSLVELHGGRLAVKSEPGVGTVASVLLSPERTRPRSEPKENLEDH